MEISDIEKRYNAKANDSYRTRRNLYLFSHILEFQNLDGISKSGFEKFVIKDDLVTIYTAQYHQYRDTDEIMRNNVKEIWTQMEVWKGKSGNNKDWKQTYVKEIFPTVFTKDEFKQLFDPIYTEQRCQYCGITVEVINRLIEEKEIFKKRNRGFQLEIDRKEANKEYTKDNSVLCCYWCNNAKTDEFSEEDFVPVGNQIRLIWNRRLEKHGISGIPEPPLKNKIH